MPSPLLNMMPPSPGCWLSLLPLLGPRQSVRGVRPRDQGVEWHRQARIVKTNSVPPSMGDGDIGQKFI